MSLKIFDGNDLPHELLLRTRQKAKLRNAFNNSISTELKLSKAQIFKIIQSGEFLGWLISKLAGPLTKVAIPLAKNILFPLGIAAAAPTIDAGIEKNTRFGTTTLITSNREMNDIMKIFQALQCSNILLEGATETIKNETKEKKGRFLSMLLGTLGASLLGNLLAGRGIVRVGSENKKGKGIVRAGTGKQWDF